MMQRRRGCWMARFEPAEAPIRDDSLAIEGTGSEGVVSNVRSEGGDEKFTTHVIRASGGGVRGWLLKDHVHVARDKSEQRSGGGIDQVADEEG